MNTLLRALFIMLLAAVVIVSGAAAGCSAQFGSQTVRGSGVVASEPRDASGFSEVRLGGTGEVIIEQTGKDSVTVEAEDNILPLLRTAVENGVLRLDIQNGVSIQTTKPIRYHVTTKTLTGVGVSGSGTVRATGIDADRFTADISGSGNAALAGRADDLKLKISGSGSVDAAGLNSRSVAATISGSGDATVNATDRLDATVSGSGSVRYGGSPQVNQRVSGSGRVARR